MESTQVSTIAPPAADAEVEPVVAIVPTQPIDDEVTTSVTPTTPAALADTPAELRKKHKAHRHRKVKQTHGTYSKYIHRVFRSVPSTSDMTISSKAMAIMESFVNDIFHRLSMEAGILARYSKRRTLSARDFQTAARLVLPGELATHAIRAGSRAVAAFADVIAHSDDVVTQ